MKKGAGFTLMEILVSMAILAVIGMIILNAFSRSMRGGNKAQIILAIKQNGLTVLEQMDKTIRGADNVVCPLIIPPNTSSSSNTSVIMKNGTYVRYRFIPQTLSENGLVQQDNPAKTINISSSQEETDQEFINRICDSASLMDNDDRDKAITLTDTNTTTGVSIQGGSFSRSELAGFKDVVTINFDVTQGVGVSGGTTSDIDPVNFKTTIQLR